MASDPRDPTGRLKAEFNRLDRNGDGTLSSDELFEGLRFKYEQDELSEMFDKLDTNGDKNISLDEYLNYWFENGGVDPRFGVMLVKDPSVRVAAVAPPAPVEDEPIYHNPDGQRPRLSLSLIHI